MEQKGLLADAILVAKLLDYNIYETPSIRWFQGRKTIKVIDDRKGTYTIVDNDNNHTQYRTIRDLEKALIEFL